MSSQSVKRVRCKKDSDIEPNMNDKSGKLNSKNIEIQEGELDKEQGRDVDSGDVSEEQDDDVSEEQEESEEDYDDEEDDGNNKFDVGLTEDQMMRRINTSLLDDERYRSYSEGDPLVIRQKKRLAEAHERLENEGGIMEIVAFSEQKGWASLPFSTLRQIVDYTAFPQYREFDEILITLTKVCRSWRSFIHSEQWRMSGPRKLDWDTLVRIPTGMFKSFMSVHCVDPDEEDMEAWDVDDPWMGSEPNLPLMLEVLPRCTNLQRIYLSGTLHAFIFRALGKYCTKLWKLDICYAKANPAWLFMLKDCNEIRQINFERSYWVDDTVMCAVSSFAPKLFDINMDRLGGVSGLGLATLIDECPDLQHIYLTRALHHNAIDAFKAIAEHKRLRVLEFECCEGITDSCLKVLFDPKACPTLESLNIEYTGCSNRCVKQFEKKRRGVDVEFEAIEY
eukprot:353954_1